MILIPLCCFVIVWTIRKCYPQLQKKGALRKDVIIAAVEYAVMLVILLVLHLFASGSHRTIPILVSLLCCSLPFACSLLQNDKKAVRIVPLLKRLSILSAVILLAEVFVMNGKCYAPEHNSLVYTAEDISFSGDAEPDGQFIQITGNAQIDLRDVPDQMGGLLLFVSREHTKDTLPFKVSLTMQDDNFTDNPQMVQQKYEMAYDSMLRLSFHPYGHIHALHIGFEEVREPVTLNYICAVQKLPFAFSRMRFWILFAIGSLIIVIITEKWYRIRFHSRKPVHAVCVLLTIALCVGLCACVQRSWDKPYEYNPEAIHTEDPFAMTLDAFEKGQLWLDLEADPALEEIENVYVRDLRDKSDAFSYWDLAYYKGHYYAYFGVTPVLLFYYPYYLLGHQQPTVNMAMLFFGVLAAVFLCLAILELLHLMCPHPNLLLLLLSFPTACSISGIYWLLNIGGTYGLPPVCGLCFVYLCIWTGLLACRMKRMPARMALLLLSGTAMAFAFGARPSVALNAAILVPLFIGILLYRRQKLQLRLGQAACFLVPVALGAAGLMYYNQVRFGSPLEFGTSYQLTVSNVNANRMYLSDLPGAIYNYFLIPPRTKTTFPFLDTQWGSINNFQHYIYAEGVIGWLSYALISFGILCLPKGLAADSSVMHLRTNRVQRRSLLVVCFLMPVLLAWMDFSMGGSCQRYFFDVIPLLLLGCLTVLMRCCRKPDGNRHLYVLSCLALCSSFMLMWLVLLGHRDCGLVRNLPNLYNTVEELVVFWQ